MNDSNTRIRRFGIGFTALNHIEFTTSDGDMIGIPFSEMEDGLVEELEESRFPYNFHTIPPAADTSWYDHRVMCDIYDIDFH